MTAHETASTQPAGPPAGERRRGMPAWAGMLLRVAITAALLAVGLRSVEWSKILALFATVDWRWWLGGFAAGMIAQLIAAIRWAALARPIGFPFSTGLFVWRFFEGVFFNLCLPGSIGGDLVKAYRLADSTHGRLLAGCTVLADRLTGLSALGVLAGAAAIAKEWSLGLETTLAVGAALLVAVLIAIWLGVGSLDRLIELFPQQHAARQFIAQLLPYQVRPSLMTKAVAWSLLVQAGGAVAVALIARGIGVSLPISIWFAVVPLIALAMVLPISISGVGVREGGLAFLLAPSGVPAEQAVAIGLLWFLSSIVTGLLGGLLFLIDRNPVQPPNAV